MWFWKLGASGIDDRTERMKWSLDYFLSFWNGSDQIEVLKVILFKCEQNNSLLVLLHYWPPFLQQRLKTKPTNTHSTVTVGALKDDDFPFCGFDWNTFWSGDWLKKTHCALHFMFCIMMIPCYVVLLLRKAVKEW